MFKNGKLACLLCGCSEVHADENLTGEQLRALWQAFGFNFNPHAFGPITMEFNVSLMRCCACGFRFYDPELAGGAEFYEEMMSKCHYPSISPEFTFALEFAKKNDLKKLFDVGGGEGHFLDLALNAGMETSGVELNRDAAKLASDKGHLMFNKRMEEIMVDELDGGTEILTLFQVIEHVPSPVKFLLDAVRLVRPGGYIVIAVPNESRMLGLLHYDPANWPPHHISRWRSADLITLGKTTGLNLIEQRSDLLTGQSILWAIKLHNKLAAALGRQKPIGSTRLFQALTMTYRFLGCKYFMPFSGLSIYAVFRKPCD
jgi:2-polyprenyl-3-methyl-5-hydroxy-6-metoxy-1,4-benzoquinol methylase